MILLAFKDQGMMEQERLSEEIHELLQKQGVSSYVKVENPFRMEKFIHSTIAGDVLRVSAGLVNNGAGPVEVTEEYA